MIDIQALKSRFIDLAIRGKLVEQRPEEGTAEDLLEKIQAEKAQLIKEKKLKKDKPLDPIAEDEVPFEIPENWKWVRLDDIVCKTIKRGKSPTYVEESSVLVFAQKCNLKRGGINMELALYLDENKLSKYPDEEFMRDQDIVINSTGGGTMGRVGIFHDSDNPSNLRIVPDSHVTVVRVGNNISASYVYYYLKGKQSFLENLGDGTTNQQELKPDIIRGQLFPLPPLSEQQRIVAKLESILSVLNTAQDSLNHGRMTAQKIREGILQLAIQGKLVDQRPEEGTAEDLLSQIQAEKAQLIKEKKIKKDKPLDPIADDKIPFEIPENWKWVRLDDIVCKTIKRGKSPTYVEESSVLVFAQKCNLKRGGINMELALYLDENKLSKYPDEEFMCDQDIVINSTGGGTMGRVGIFHDADNPRKLRIVPDSHVTVVRVGNNISASYVYYYLKSKQSFLESLGDGTTNQQELKPDIIRSQLFPLPPLSEQQRIAAKIEKIFSMLKVLEQS